MLLSSPQTARESGRAAAWLLLVAVLLCVPVLWLVLDGEDAPDRNGSTTAEMSTLPTAQTNSDASQAGVPQVARNETAPVAANQSTINDADPELVNERDEEFPAGIIGRVTTLSGTPIAGALCEVLPTEELRRIGASRSDETGQFRIRGLRVEDGDRVAVRISHPEFAPTIVDEVEVAFGVLIPVGTLVLYPASSLSGVCIDEESGQALGGAKVNALLVFEGSSVVLERSTATADGQGRFQLNGLPGGFVRILPSKPGYASRLLEMVSLDAGENRANYTVRLRATAPLTGVVKDTDGRGLAGIEVLYRPNPTAVPDLEMQSARSDSEGKFRFLSPDPERGYVIAVRDPRYLPTSQISTGWDARAVEIQLDRGSRFRVIIEGKFEGEPEFTLESSLAAEKEPDPRYFRPVREEHLLRFFAQNGAYESATLDPSLWYRVSVLCGSSLSAQSPALKLDPEANAPQEVRLKLSAGAVLQARIVDESGTAIEGALARLMRHEASQALRSDPAGKMSFAAFGGGEFDIKIEKEGYAPFEDRVVVPSAGLTQDFVLERGGSIHGRVTIGGSAPAKPMIVWLRSSSFDVQRSVTTAEDGAYAFAGLPLDESYELFPLQGARPNSYSAQLFSHPIEDDDRFAFDEEYEFLVDLEESDPDVLFDIKLPRVSMAHVRGVIRDETGPRSGLSVTAMLFETGYEQRVLSGADGRFDLEIMGSGEIDLEVHAKSGEELLWVDTIELFEAQEMEIEILLRTARVDVAVMDENEVAIPGARVRAKLLSASGSSPHAPIGSSRLIDTDNSGVAHFESLAEGRYDFEASAMGFAVGVLRQREIMAGGEAEPLQMRLQRAAIADLRLSDATGSPLQASMNLEIYDASGALVALPDGAPRTTVRNGKLRIEHLRAGGYRFVLTRAGTRLERYADLNGGAEPQVIEWRLDLGGAGDERGANRDSQEEGKEKGR